MGAYELREDCCCGEEDECHEHEVVVEEEAFEDGVADVESEEVGGGACCEACPGCDLFISLSGCGNGVGGRGNMP